MKRIVESFGVPKLRPLLIVGAALVMFGGVLTWAFLFNPRSPAFVFRPDRSEIYIAAGLIVPVASFYVLTGLGVILSTRWGYYLFRAFLYVHLFVGFPVTTLFAYRGLAYIKGSEVRRHFHVSLEAEEGQGPSKTTRIVVILVAAVLVALYAWVMLTF